MKQTIMSNNFDKISETISNLIGKVKQIIVPLLSHSDLTTLQFRFSKADVTIMKG